MTAHGSAATGRSLWRAEDPETFDATVLTAAEQLRVQPLAVEKDYWVCEALRAIQAAYPDAVIFKGGTSLEKIRLVQRFSEDLDLLITGEFGGAGATKSALRRMCEAARAAVDGTLTDEKSGGTLGTMHRRAYLHPPLVQQSSSSGAIADPHRVLLELGQSGGKHPSSSREITSLLTRQLQASGFPVADFADLTPFTVQVLHPGRTLLEKLLRINNFASAEDARRDVHGWPRIGRQFYDVWALLGSPEVLDFLADVGQVAAVLNDCYQVSTLFVPDEPLPAGGFAESSAFDASGSLAGRLREEHDAAMRDLYYGTSPAPTFDEVLTRVREHAELLNIVM
ncbi:nucleotidyl transferase AbiEii/AbiGii toxin family protein [Micromonospora sp. NPDC023966]|uniref:nucleotidyl transferase AbiEii/AbiGii toxin family protein n=1 Tax=Micromonospora sp. NPDC023966 TaxID=3154699 RepID=UPI0033D111E1